MPYVLRQCADSDAVMKTTGGDIGIILMRNHPNPAQSGFKLFQALEVNVLMPIAKF